MRNLHEKLMRESNWYNSWHSHRGHGLAHWFLFLFVALLITSAVSEGINKNYLSENINMAAAVVATRPTLSNKASKPISGQYIIVFKDDVKEPKGLANQLTKEYNGQLLFAYTKAIKGFSAKIPDVAINGLKKNPNIKYVEQDTTVQATFTQSIPPWGLDRIDQMNTPIDRIYNYNYRGTGVSAYVIDTGIRSTHTEFTGRMGNGYTSINDSYGTDGCHWHGTHVAGTLGGTTYGVAKSVTLHSVRVLDCAGSGTTAGVIAGIDWVAQNKALPAVANMSISGGFSQSLNDATRNLVNSGVVVAVAAGNAASDACTYSPSSESSAITIGATTLGAGAPDYQASYSNYGSCLDIYAPGTGILSASNETDTASISANGTSMATPHVAGVAALYLEQNPTATPSQVANAIITKGSGGVLVGLGTGSPNLLVNSLFNGTYTPPTVDTQAPTTPIALNGSAWVDKARIDLSWGASTDNIFLAGYKVYRNASLIATLGNVLFYGDSSATPGVAYTYTVAAFDGSGNNSGMSNSVTITLPASQTNVPVDIISYSVLNILNTTATIKWETNISSTGSFTYSVRKGAPITTSDGGNSTTHYIYLTGLKPNTSFSYQINASSGGTTDNVTGTFKTRRN